MDDFERRYMFHARLGELICLWYYGENSKIGPDDPDREQKVQENKERCKAELRQLNKYFFGKKMVKDCKRCPLFASWLESTANSVMKGCPTYARK